MRATNYTGTIDFAFQRWPVYRKVAHNAGAASAPVRLVDAGPDGRTTPIRQPKPNLLLQLLR